MDKTQTKTRQFNLLLTEKEHRQLSDLAVLQNCSAAQALRIALRAAVSHAVNAPCCADGRSCLVPHLHIRNNTPCQPNQ